MQLLEEIVARAAKLWDGKDMTLRTRYVVATTQTLLHVGSRSALQRPLKLRIPHCA